MTDLIERAREQASNHEYLTGSGERGWGLQLLSDTMNELCDELEAARLVVEAARDAIMKEGMVYTYGHDAIATMEFGHALDAYDAVRGE